MRCVPARDFTVSKAVAWRSSINESAPYQREGAVWSDDQRGRFIDSLLNGYDVPKLYLHDLRGIHPTKVYAVVDGKQRLHAIWDFVGGAYALGPDFVLEADPDPTTFGATPPGPGAHWDELDPAWRGAFLGTYLSVVLVQRATEADIDELFFRLNSGVPLTPAERRGTAAGRRARAGLSVVHGALAEDG